MLRCIVISKVGKHYGPFDSHAEVREFIARNLPNEPEDDGENETPNGWRCVSLWPPRRSL